MPMRRQYRHPMIGLLEGILRDLERWERERARREGEKPRPILFPIFVIFAYKKLNPDFTKLLSKNFTFLEAVAAYVGRYILLEGERPDRNITYIFNAILSDWNKATATIGLQIRRNPYDFIETINRTRRNPDGITISYTSRLIEPERGDDAVDLTQMDMDRARAGIDRRRDELENCRDEPQVDIRIDELLREWGLI